MSPRYRNCALDSTFAQLLELSNYEFYQYLSKKPVSEYVPHRRSDLRLSLRAKRGNLMLSCPLELYSIPKIASPWLAMTGGRFDYVTAWVEPFVPRVRRRGLSIQPTVGAAAHSFSSVVGYYDKCLGVPVLHSV